MSLSLDSKTLAPLFNRLAWRLCSNRHLDASVYLQHRVQRVCAHEYGPTLNLVRGCFAYCELCGHETEISY